MTNVQIQRCKINTPPVKVQTNVSNFIINFSTLPSSALPPFFIPVHCFTLFSKSNVFLLSPLSCFSVDMDPVATNLRREGPGQFALGERSGNAWNRAGGKATQPEQLRRATGTSKRKFANRECAAQEREENQPPQKRPPAKAPAGGPGKTKVKTAGKKLIAGQGKLTGFFRL